METGLCQRVGAVPIQLVHWRIGRTVTPRRQPFADFEGYLRNVRIAKQKDTLLYFPFTFFDGFRSRLRRTLPT
jgi:hypothetical protein